MVKKTWQERQAEYEQMVKIYTCPSCGKRARFNCFQMPIHGCFSHGQWYCSREHASIAQRCKEGNHAHVEILGT